MILCPFADVANTHREGAGILILAQSGLVFLTHAYHSIHRRPSGHVHLCLAFPPALVKSLISLSDRRYTLNQRFKGDGARRPRPPPGGHGSAKEVCDGVYGAAGHTNGGDHDRRACSTDFVGARANSVRLGICDTIALASPPAVASLAT